MQVHEPEQRSLHVLTRPSIVNDIEFEAPGRRHHESTLDEHPPPLGAKLRQAYGLQTAEYKRGVYCWYDQGYLNLLGQVCHANNVGLDWRGIYGSYVSLTVSFRTPSSRGEEPMSQPHNLYWIGLYEVDLTRVICYCVLRFMRGGEEAPSLCRYVTIADTD